MRCALLFSLLVLAACTEKEDTGRDIVIIGSPHGLVSMDPADADGITYVATSAKVATMTVSDCTSPVTYDFADLQADLGWEDLERSFPDEPLPFFEGEYCAYGLTLDELVIEARGERGETARFTFQGVDVAVRNGESVAVEDEERFVLELAQFAWIDAKSLWSESTDIDVTPADGRYEQWLHEIESSSALWSDPDGDGLLGETAGTVPALVGEERE